MKEQNRKWAIHFQGLAPDLNIDQIIAALMGHAAKWGGCVRCLNSRPYNPYDSVDPDRWLRRTCALGLRQEECGTAYMPVVEET